MKNEAPSAPGNNVDLKNVATMTSEAELASYLEGGEMQDEEGEKPKPAPKPLKRSKEIEEPTEVFDDNSEDQEEEEQEEDPKKKKKKASKTNDDEGLDLGEEEDEEQEEEEEEESDFIIHKLNKDNKLGLNLEKINKLIEDGKFTKKQEAELVSGLLKRVVGNANARISEYQGIQHLLEDEETKTFLKAKKEGKTLKDIASTYATSVQGMSDEAIVRTDLKKKYSTLSDEEISDMVQENSKRGTLPKMANAIREENKKSETFTVEQQRIAEKAQQDADDAAMRQHIGEYAEFVKSVKTVHGVPVTDEMKQAAFIMSTARDENGDTELDQMLQSNKGIFMASLGIKFLKQIINNAGTTASNKGRQGILNLLDDSAENLQSSGSRTRGGKQKDDSALFNQF